MNIIIIYKLYYKNRKIKINQNIKNSLAQLTFLASVSDLNAINQIKLQKMKMK